MLISNGFGIIVGNVMGKDIPERAIKWGAALLFIAFGVYGLFENLPGHYRGPAVIAGSLITLSAAIYAAARLDARRQSHLSVYENTEIASPRNEQSGLYRRQ